MKKPLREIYKQLREENSYSNYIFNGISDTEIKKVENCHSLYPTIGENLDYINSNNIKIDFLYRKLDQYSWQYCNKGFFNFKNHIPKIISTFN